MASRRASDEIAMRPSRGRGYTGSRYPTRALIGALSEVINGLLGDPWKLRESSIFIKCAIVKWSCDLHRMAESASKERSTIVTWSPHYRGPIIVQSWPDHRAIMAWSSSDRGHDQAQLWSDQNTIMATIALVWWLTISVRSWPSIPPPHRIKRPKFSGKNPL